MTELVPAAEARALVAIDEARREIAIAKSTGDIGALSEWRDRAAAILHYTRMRDGGQDAANDAGEVKVRAEAALGAIDREANPVGVHRQRDTPTVTQPEVSPTTRAAWRKLGALQDDQLDAAITKARQDENRGVTTTSVLNATNSKPKNAEPEKRRVIGSRPRDLRTELIAWFGQGRLVLRLLEHHKIDQDLSSEVRRDLEPDVDLMEQLVDQLRREL